VPCYPLGLPLAGFDNEQTGPPTAIQHEPQAEKLIEHAKDHQKDGNREDRKFQRLAKQHPPSLA
jgi:hypothetical protein